MVQANGNSSISHSYNFIDTDPENGKIFYRLKTIDFSGKTIYSRIVSVKYELANLIELFPNPAKAFIHFLYNGELPAKVIVYNSAGKRVLHYEVSSSSSVIDISKLSRGVYYLKIGNTQVSFAKE